MKRNENRPGSITQPILKELMDRRKAEAKEISPKVEIGSEPLKPSDLFQDDGSGYNKNLTFPQK